MLLVRQQPTGEKYDGMLSLNLIGVGEFPHCYVWSDATKSPTAAISV